jgi:hypothetical protein
LTIHGGSNEKEIEDIPNTNSSDTALDQPLNTLPKEGSSSKQQGHMTKTNVGRRNHNPKTHLNHDDRSHNQIW